VPHAADLAIDEQDRVVSCLTRRGERAAGGGTRVQPVPGLARDDVGVEIGQQADPTVRLGRRCDVARQRPGGRAVEIDALQLPG
jgi:hypothetical protein